MLLCLLSCANKKVGRLPGRDPARAWKRRKKVGTEVHAWIPASPAAKRSPGRVETAGMTERQESARPIRRNPYFSLDYFPVNWKIVLTFFQSTAK